MSKKNDMEKYQFTVHPCNFDVKINEIKPFYVCPCKSIILDLQIISNCNVKSYIRIKSVPRCGKVRLINPSTIIYKPTKIFFGFDLFQVLITNDYGEERTENILISLKRCKRQRIDA